MAHTSDNYVMPSFRENLEYLFDRRRRPDGRPYSNEEVAAAIRAAGGSITGAYLSALRRDDRGDPRGSYLVWLGRFFRVPAGFFLDPSTNERVRAQLDPVPDAPRPSSSEQRPGVLFRDFSAMSPRGQELLAGIMRAVDVWDRDDDEWDDEAAVGPWIHPSSS